MARVKPKPPHPKFLSHTKPSVRRSSKWPGVRRKHLLLHPECELCGSTKFLEVHHIRPYHLHPELELVEGNLITLCECPGHSCHHMAGHYLDWHSYNLRVRRDVLIWKKRILKRPKGLLDAS